MRVQKILVGVGTSKPIVDDIEGGSDVAPKTNVPQSALATTSATTVETVLTINKTKVEDGEPELRDHEMMLYEVAP